MSFRCVNNKQSKTVRTPLETGNALTGIAHLKTTGLVILTRDLSWLKYSSIHIPQSIIPNRWVNSKSTVLL